MTKIENEARSVVAEHMAHAVRTLMTSYALFIETGAHDDPKQFKEHYDACKAAMNHLDHLIKLTQWSEEQGSRNDVYDLATLIENARAEIDGNEG